VVRSTTEPFVTFRVDCARVDTPSQGKRERRGVRKAIEPHLISLVGATWRFVAHWADRAPKARSSESIYLRRRAKGHLRQQQKPNGSNGYKGGPMPLMRRTCFAQC
jgi:hypothetical protein